MRIFCKILLYKGRNWNRVGALREKWQNERFQQKTNEFDSDRQKEIVPQNERE